jgi:hypothetical protein
MTVTLDQLKTLHQPFPETDISWRVGRKEGGQGQALPYINNRLIMDSLDMRLGPDNWRNEFAEVVANGRFLAVRCTIFVKLESGWVGKADAAPVEYRNVSTEGPSREVPNDLAVKGAYSDAMKRAAVHWGLGRYLYGFTAPWVPLSERGQLLEIPRLPAHMLPEGTVIAEEPPAQVAAPVAEAAPVQVAAPVAEAAPVQVAAAVAKVSAAQGLALPEGTPPEQLKLVADLISKIGKLPVAMLRGYVDGPKGQEKLSESSRKYLIAKLKEAEAATA